MSDDKSNKTVSDDKTNKVYVDAELIADTRDSEQMLGFGTVAQAERRMLFQAGVTYVELLSQPEGSMNFDGGWLFGQFIRHSDEVKEQYEPPIYAVLQGANGLTGAAKMTDEGEFAVPFQETGEFSLTLEPRTGPTVRLTFTH